MDVFLLVKSSSSTGILADEFASFKFFLMQYITDFSKQLETIAREVQFMEMRSRRKTLLLHDVEKHKDEETAQVVADIVYKQLKAVQISKVAT